jgi:hypothetical protein
MPRRPTALEKMSLRRELKRLLKEERKFRLAFEAEGNSDSLDGFCARGLIKIRALISEINSQL